MPSFLVSILDFVRWVIGLAKPENLREIVNFGGHVWVSYAILFAIIFSETGLLIGFFLPGDSLLFAAGFLASQEVFNFAILNVVLMIAAVVGDAVNYALGLQMTSRVFERGRLPFVKHEHLIAAKVFYEKYGNLAIVLCRFVPLVRTFTPFVAGVARMSYSKFVFYNVVGGCGWVLLMTTAGYWLGQIELIAKNFEATIIIIIFISLLPVFAGVWKNWRASRA